MRDFAALFLHLVMTLSFAKMESTLVLAREGEGRGLEKPGCLGRHQSNPRLQAGAASRVPASRPSVTDDVDGAYVRRRDARSGGAVH